MALQKQNVSLSFLGGIDTKSDPKQIPIGKLSVLENGIFQTKSMIRKRNGNQLLSTAVLGESPITAGIGLTTFENQLNLFDGSLFYSYNESTMSWSKKGALGSLNLEAATILKNNYSQSSQDSSYNSIGLSAYVWEDSSGGSRFSILDSVTGQQIVTNQLINAHAIIPKVVSLPNYFLIFYINTSSGQIEYLPIAVNTPHLSGAPVTVTNDFKIASPMFDVVTVGTRVYLAYNKNSGGITLLYLTSTLNQSAKTTTGADSATAINVISDSLNNIWVLYYQGSAVKAFIKGYEITPVLALTTIQTVASVRNITGSIIGSTANIFYEIANTLPENNYIRINTLTRVGVVGTPSVLIRSVGLASKAFTYNNQSYILAANSSTLQSKFFLLTNTGQSVLRLSGEPELGGGLTAKSTLPAVNQVSTGNYQFSYLQVDSVSFTAVNTNNSTVETLNSRNGIMQADINFTEGAIFSTLTLGSNLNLTGSMPSIYDGNNVVEEGFDLYPENLTATSISTFGGLSIGQYQHVAVYEWTDNKGQKHQSSPSIPVTSINQTLVLNGAIGSSTNTFSVPLNSAGSLMPGMLVTGTNIATGTYLLYLVDDSNGILSQNTTGGPVDETLTFTPAVTIGANSIQGNSPNQNQIRVQQLQYLPVISTFTSGSNLVTVQDPTFLKVGMTIENFGGFLDSSSQKSTITAINGKVITLAHNATATGSEVISIGSIQFSADTNTSNTVTNIPVAVRPLLTTNQRIYIRDSATIINSNTDLITYSGGSSLTLQTQSASDTAVHTFFAGIDITAAIRPGQQISGTGIVGTPTISSVTGGLETGTNSTITLSTQSIDLAYSGNTAPDTTLTISNTFETSLQIPTLRVTNKPNNVNVVVYRTEKNGTVFYRVGQVANDPSVDSVAFIDSTADNQILSNQQLYTTGGVVENNAAPATDIITTYKNREILVPNEAPLTWWYSKQVVPGSPVEFSASFTANIDPRGGAITALGVMDDKLIFFKETNVFALVGTGPSPNGANNDYSEPQLVPTETGCNNPKSIVLTPVGLMFQSPKGIYLLARNLETVYIGVDVEAFNSFTVTSAQLLANVNQVRFTLDNGTALVYDYEFKQWSVFTNHSAVDSCIFQNQFTFLKSNGQVYQETPGQYTDNGSFIKLKLTTAWFSFAGFQAFQRAYSMYVIGNYLSPHKLHTTIAYDFNPNSTQENYIDAGTLMRQEAYGVSSPYGSDPVYGAPTGINLYQWRIDLARQKCESLQVTIEDTQNSNYGEGLSLSSIAFEIGAKKGLNKLPANQSFG